MSEQKKRQQLKKAFESGLLDDDTYQTALKGLQSEASASSSGSGSAAAAGGVAAGRQGIGVGGNVYGGIRIPANPKSRAGLRRAYLGYVFNQARKVPLAGVDRKSIDEQSRRDVDLAAIYTALLTRQSEIEGEFDPRSAEPPDDKRQVRFRQGRALSALEVLNNEQYLALLGDPGSGKSTFVHYLSMCLAGEELKIKQVNLESLTQPPPGSKGPGKEESQPQPWDHGALIPVPVVLRDLAVRGLPESLEDVTGLTLWEFIASELPKNLRRFAQPLQEELQEQGGLVLLDGLDEVPEAEERRLLVREAVKSLAAAFPKLRILVTSRVYAYQKQAWKLEGFAEATLAPFNADQVNRFVECWYAHVGPVNREVAVQRPEGFPKATPEARPKSSRRPSSAAHACRSFPDGRCCSP